MAVPEISSLASPLPSSVVALFTDAASQLIAANDDDSSTSSSTAKRRRRAAEGMLAEGPLKSILQGIGKDSGLTASMADALKGMLKASLGTANLTPALADEINGLIQQFGAVVATASSSEDPASDPAVTMGLTQLQAAITACLGQVSNEPSTEVDLSTVFSGAAALVVDAATDSPEISRVVPKDIDPNDPFAGLDLNNGKNAAAFMALLLLASILMGQNSAKNSISSTDLSSAFIKLSTDLLEKAQKDLQKYQDDVKAEKSKSALGKIFSSIASALLIVIGGLSGQPELIATGALMLSMQLSGGQEKLDEQLAKLPLAGKIVCELLIAAGEAAVCCGAVAGMGAVASGLGINATTAVAGTVESEVEMVAVDAVEDGGAAAVGNVVADSASEASSIADTAVAQTGQSLARKSAEIMKKLLQQIADGPFRRILLQQMGNGQSWGDFMRVFVRLGDACGAQTSQEKEDQVAMIGGAALGLSVGALSLTRLAGQPLTFDLSKQLGQVAVGRVKAFLEVSKGIMAVTGATYNIQAALEMFKEGDIIGEQAMDQAMLAVFNYVEEVIKAANSGNSESAQNTARTDAAIADRMADIVNPFKD